MIRIADNASSTNMKMKVYTLIIIVDDHLYNSMKIRKVNNDWQCCTYKNEEKYILKKNK